MKQIFDDKVLPYNLRCSNKLQLPKAKTTGLGIETVRFVVGKVWETLPPELKRSNSLKIVKRIIKTYKCNNCNCRLCNNFSTQFMFFIVRLYFTLILFHLYHCNGTYAYAFISFL